MQEYNLYLDSMFSETPGDEVLLELEECSDNYNNTFLIQINLERFFSKA